MKKLFLTSILMLSFLVPFTQANATPQGLPQGEIFTSKHSVTINGNKINLEAETGTVQLRDENDKPIALMGFTHYKKVGSKESYVDLFKNKFVILYFFGIFA